MWKRRSGDRFRAAALRGTGNQLCPPSPPAGPHVRRHVGKAKGGAGESSCWMCGLLTLRLLIISRQQTDHNVGSADNCVSGRPPVNVTHEAHFLCDVCPTGCRDSDTTNTRWHAPWNLQNSAAIPSVSIQLVIPQLWLGEGWEQMFTPIWKCSSCEVEHCSIFVIYLNRGYRNNLRMTNQRSSQCRLFSPTGVTHLFYIPI